jgi:hypothetical protein
MKNQLNHSLMIMLTLSIMLMVLNKCNKCETVPVVTTKSASFVTKSGATLNGTVNFYGQKATVIFECGITTSYGQTMYPTNLNFGIVPLDFHAPIIGLSSGTTYHYRIKVVGKCRTTNGGDILFTTLN